MALDPPRQPWTTNAEAAIRRLRDVEDVRIQAAEEGIREIHVVSSSRRPAKQIVRDIQSLLEARFSRTFDHRVVSVAFVDPGPRPLIAQPIELHPLPESSDPLEDRIRFGSVNLYISGSRAQAQVELRWKGAPRTGSASGWSTREGAFRLIAEATLAAVQEFVDEEVGLGLAEVEIIRMGRQEVVVVGLALLAHRQEKLLVGSCAVEQDVQQAVALATLGALNRVLGGLRTKEPTEYVLRPSSAQEASGAKRS
ncbi:MAG: hypothetical protein HYR73_00255 [Candidatus Eisenbacteria bacterium]|nr:hypothetical protein [Candidatus Eisenbacteria bacterium]